mgnify:CR=1 FL=1
MKRIICWYARDLSHICGNTEIVSSIMLCRNPKVIPWMKIDENNNTIPTNINANDASDYCNLFQADTCFNNVLKKCCNCGKMFKNIKLHLTKKPVCKNSYDLLSMEVESAARTKRRQSLYKQQNQLQISEK